MNFGEKLQQKRNAMKLTQEEVADQLFVSRQTISNWENEVSYPDLDMLIKISNLYHISLDKLIKENESMRISLSKKELNKKLGDLLILLSISSIILLLIILMNQFIPSMSVNKITRVMMVAVVIVNSAVIIRTTVFMNNINENHQWEYMKKISLKVVIFATFIVIILSSILYYFHQEFIIGTLEGVWIGLIILWIYVKYTDDSK